MVTQPLMNQRERLGRRVLIEANAGRGEVHAKVRLADVVSIGDLHLPDREFDYATRAHLDFVVTDTDEVTPLFAVEIDGGHHEFDQRTRWRDRTKDAICERSGLPLLRVEPAALTPGPRERRLLEYLVDGWFYACAFEEAQEDRSIPWDEPCMYEAVFEVRDGRIDFVNDLGAPGVREVVTAARDGLVTGTYTGLAGYDTDGYAHAHSWVPLASPGLNLWAHYRLKAFNFFAGVTPASLAVDLADDALGSLVRQARSGGAVAVTDAQLEEQLDTFHARLDGYGVAAKQTIETAMVRCVSVGTPG